MKRKNKYNAQPTVVGGIRFASKREAKRYRELKLLEKAGEIKCLTLQPKFNFHVNRRDVKIRSKGYPNGRKTYYLGDFSYTDMSLPSGNRRVVEDVKSPATNTPLSKLKQALVEAI